MCHGSHCYRRGAHVSIIVSSYVRMIFVHSTCLISSCCLLIGSFVNFVYFSCCCCMYYRYFLILFFFFLMIRPPPRSPLFPYTPLFRSARRARPPECPAQPQGAGGRCLLR